MPFYMVQAAYTSEAWAAQIASPQDRFAVIRGMIESSGGKLHSAYYSFGEYDIVMITEAPENVDCASILIAVAGGGAISSLKTTVLLTGDEGLQAIKGAGGVGYTTPSSQGD